MKRISIFFLILSFLVIKTVWSQDTLVLQPGPEGKDAYINDYYETNFGDYPNNFAVAGSYFTSRSLLEFDLSSIPPDAYLLAANLSFYFANNPSNPHYHCGENAAFLQRVIEPWDEHEVTWLNQPGITEQNQVTLPMSQNDTMDYTNIDVKTLFQDIISDSANSHGILFRLQVEEYNRKMMFASGDYEDSLLWPKLEIVFISCTPPAADFEYHVDGDTVSFTGISTTATSWFWDFGDGQTSDIQNPNHIYQEHGFFQVCLRVDDTCYFAEYCEIVDFCDVPPEAGFAYTTEYLTVSFQDTSIMATEYFWDFGDGYFSNLSNPSHTYAEAANYMVCLQTTNDCGSDTICVMIDLTDVSITENDEGSYLIYPNPAREVIFIKPVKDGLVTIGILDLSGKEVFLQNVDVKAEETIQIPLSQIEPGIYIMRFDSGKNRAYGKLVVVR
jgi:PKD repeat protein